MKREVIVETVKIALADDHAILRSGLKNLISRENGLEVVAEASDGRELLERLETTHCDLVILDLSMPEMNGLQTLDIIRHRFPQVKTLILSMHREKEYFKQAVLKGADGYILKDDVFERLISAIQEIIAGRKSYSSELVTFLAEEYLAGADPEPSLELLTRRELEVLKSIASGMKNRDISDELNISIRTVETHRANIMQKLSISNTAGLVKFALDNRIL
ncbi:MAG: response regulator transcription factor [Leptospiraceae bacterium]|nr:response regulator transcription factor [Leptospiraceae bacterium]MCB1200394.1 response regulator transcription factor [Leptospiraceae bacterium]